MGCFRTGCLHALKGTFGTFNVSKGTFGALPHGRSAFAAVPLRAGAAALCGGWSRSRSSSRWSWSRRCGTGSRTTRCSPGEDFGGGYDVAALTADQLARSGSTDLPDGIEPAECEELLRTRPEPANPELAAGVSARGARTAYLEVVLPAAGVSEWDTARLDEVVDTCRTTTFDDGGTEGTVEFSRLDAPVEGGFALTARVSGSDGVVTLGVAVSRWGTTSWC